MKKMLLYAIACVALSASAMQAQDVTGIWQGTLHAGRDLRLELKIVKVDTGLKATFYSIDQNGAALPTGPVKVQGGNISMDIPAIGGKYEGKLTADGSAINGTWTQGQPLDLELKKVTEDVGVADSPACCGSSADAGGCRSYIRRRDDQAKQAGAAGKSDHDPRASIYYDQYVAELADCVCV